MKCEEIYQQENSLRSILNKARHVKDTFKYYAPSEDLRRIKCIYSQSLECCHQTCPVPFSFIFNLTGQDLEKMGQGKYGNVYKIPQTNAVFKIVKVRLFEEDYRDTSSSCIETALSEVKISLSLNSLRNFKINRSSNFIKLNQIWFVRDRLPEIVRLANAKYAKINNLEDDSNDDESFSYYFVYKMENGGSTLYECSNFSDQQFLSIISQLTCSLGVAENALEFEHRDLHLSNILIKDTTEPYMHYIFNREPIKIPTFGVKVTIIDYNLSRIKLGEDVIYVDIGVGEDHFLAMETGCQWDEFFPNTNKAFIDWIATEMLLHYRDRKYSDPWQVHLKPEWYSKIFQFSCLREFYEKCLAPFFGSLSIKDVSS